MTERDKIIQLEERIRALQTSRELAWERMQTLHAEIDSLLTSNHAWEKESSRQQAKIGDLAVEKSFLEEIRRAAGLLLQAAQGGGTWPPTREAEQLQKTLKSYDLHLEAKERHRAGKGNDQGADGVHQGPTAGRARDRGAGQGPEAGGAGQKDGARVDRGDEG